MSLFHRTAITVYVVAFIVGVVLMSIGTYIQTVLSAF